MFAWMIFWCVCVCVVMFISHHSIMMDPERSLSSWIATFRANRVMEDRHVPHTLVTLPDGHQMSMFAVLDGHGGDSCVGFVAQHLGVMLQTLCNGSYAVDAMDGDHKKCCWSLSFMRRLLVDTFRRLDHAYFTMHPQDWRSGCCCLTVLIDLNENVCYVGNVGDCRCVLVQLDPKTGMCHHTKALNASHNHGMPMRKKKFMHSVPRTDTTMWNAAW